MIVSAIEHEAVLQHPEALERRGWRGDARARRRCGVVYARASRALITTTRPLVSVMHANNEVGTLQPIAEWRRSRARAARSSIPTPCSRPARSRSTSRRWASTCSRSRHTSSTGPKGIGALWIRRGVRLLPFVTGGRQERNRRAGTENVAGASSGSAWRATGARSSRRAAGSRRCATRSKRRPRGGARHGRQRRARPRVPNTTNISFDGVEAESLLIALDLEGFAVSTGRPAPPARSSLRTCCWRWACRMHRTQSAMRFSLGPATRRRRSIASSMRCRALVENSRSRSRCRRARR